MRLKGVLYIVFSFAAAACLVGCGSQTFEPRTSGWKVSKGYALPNQIAPGMMMAYTTGARSESTQLSVRCSGKTWAIYVDPGSYVASDAGKATARVEYAIGSSPERAVDADVVKDRMLLIGGLELAREMSSSTGRLRFTVRRELGAALEDEFDVSGFRGVASQLSPTCPVQQLAAAL